MRIPSSAKAIGVGAALACGVVAIRSCGDKKEVQQQVEVLPGQADTRGGFQRLLDALGGTISASDTGE